MKQEILKRAKEMNIDFGDGQTLRGLLEDMEKEIEVLESALSRVCCDIHNYRLESFPYPFKRIEHYKNLAKAELEKEQDNGRNER